MALSLIDPNRVHLIGENSILRLQKEQGGPDLTLCSFWRALVSPEGPGHVLLARSEALGDGVRLYSDNSALARWIQGLEALMRPPFADRALPVVDARFTRHRDASSYVEEVVAGATTIRLTWSELAEPFMTRLEPNNSFVGIWSVFSCLVPAGGAALTVDGRAAAGRAFPDMLEDQPTSTSFLALGEIWLHPRT